MLHAIRSAPVSLPASAVTLTSQAYTMGSGDIGKLLEVSSGAGHATITLMSAATAGNGAVAAFLKSDSSSIAVTGAVDNGSTLIRLTVGSTALLATGQVYNISGVGGVKDVKALATFPITVVDGTHVDLQGSFFSGTYTSGGSISGQRVIVSDGADRAWLTAQNDYAAFVSDGSQWNAVDWKIAPIRQVFTRTGTWTKAPLSQKTKPRLFGAGGPGGSGARRAISNIRTGGGGGGAGAIVEFEFLSALLGATETVTIPNNATVGASIAVDDTNGSAGVASGNTTFGGWLVAAAGTAGGGGNLTSAGASGISQLTQTNVGVPNGSANSATTGSAPTAAAAAQCGAGSPGGGAVVANTAAPTVAGSNGSCYAATPTTGGALVTNTSGQAGGTGADITDVDAQMGGGGGAGGQWASGVVGGNGGNGGDPGGAGGGGAASDDTKASGAGGLGGRGEARIVQTF